MLSSINTYAFVAHLWHNSATKLYFNCLLFNMQNNVGAKNELLEAINKVVQEKVLTNFGSFITVCVSFENFAYIPYSGNFSYWLIFSELIMNFTFYSSVACQPHPFVTLSCCQQCVLTFIPVELKPLCRCRLDRTDNCGGYWFKFYT